MILNYYAFVNNSPPAPRSEDGSAGGVQGEECRAVRAWKPRRTARILGGRNRAEISLSFFEFFSGGARKRKIVRENFCEVAAEAIAEAGGGAKAYDSVQSHHARGACVRCSAGNMFEQSRIIPQIEYSENCEHGESKFIYFRQESNGGICRAKRDNEFCQKKRFFIFKLIFINP